MVDVVSPRRRDGRPSELGHSVYSERQRTIVLTFDTVAEAIAFDTLTIDEIGELIRLFAVPRETT